MSSTALLEACTHSAGCEQPVRTWINRISMFSSIHPSGHPSIHPLLLEAEVARDALDALSAADLLLQARPERGCLLACAGDALLEFVHERHADQEKFSPVLVYREEE